VCFSDRPLAGRHLGGDPPSVEAALLGPDALVIDSRTIHPSRVEGDVIAQLLISGRRVPVASANRLDSSPVDDRVHVPRASFELTLRRTCVTGSQHLHTHLCRWHVDGRRVAGLGHTQRASERRSRQGLPRVPDHHVPLLRARLAQGRAASPGETLLPIARACAGRVARPSRYRRNPPAVRDGDTRP
jgi:hypothetical protein